MLTSPPELLPQIVYPMDRDAKGPPTSFWIPPHSEPQPQVPSHSSVTSSRVNGGRKAANRRSGCLHGVQEPTQEREKVRDAGAVPKPGCLNESLAKCERGGSTVHLSQSLSVKIMRVDAQEMQLNEINTTSAKQKASLGNKADMQDQLTEHKGGRGQKRKMSFPPTTHQLEDGTTGRSMYELDRCQSEREKEPPESPPPVKRWVIGPLFQSLKSKMASFTEIVMSPIRLFKPIDNSPPSSTLHDIQKQCPLDLDPDRSNGHSSESEKGQMDTGESNNSVQKRSRVAQRLKFDLNTNDQSGPKEEYVCLTKQDAATVSPIGGRQRDSLSVQSQTIPEEKIEIDASPCRARSPLLRSVVLPASCGALDSLSATRGSNRPHGAPLEEPVIPVDFRQRRSCGKRVCQNEGAFPGRCDQSSSPLAEEEPGPTKQEGERVLSDKAETDFMKGSSPLTSSVYYTPLGSLCLAEDTKEGSLGQLGDLEDGKEGTPLQVPVRTSPRKMSKNTSVTFPASIELSSTMKGANVSFRVSGLKLPDGGEEETQYGDEEEKKQWPTCPLPDEGEVPPHVESSSVPPGAEATLKGWDCGKAHETRQRDGKTRQREALETERDPKARKSVKLVKGEGARGGKAKKKNRVHDGKGCPTVTQGNEEKVLSVQIRKGRKAVSTPKPAEGSESRSVRKNSKDMETIQVYPDKSGLQVSPERESKGRGRVGRGRGRGGLILKTPLTTEFDRGLDYSRNDENIQDVSGSKNATPKENKDSAVPSNTRLKNSRISVSSHLELTTQLPRSSQDGISPSDFNWLETGKETTWNESRVPSLDSLFEEEIPHVLSKHTRGKKRKDSSDCQNEPTPNQKRPPTTQPGSSALQSAIDPCEADTEKRLENGQPCGQNELKAKLRRPRQRAKDRNSEETFQEEERRPFRDLDAAMGWSETTKMGPSDEGLEAKHRQPMPLTLRVELVRLPMQADSRSQVQSRNPAMRNTNRGDWKREKAEDGQMEAEVNTTCTSEMLAELFENDSVFNKVDDVREEHSEQFTKISEPQEKREGKPRGRQRKVDRQRRKCVSLTRRTVAEDEDDQEETGEQMEEKKEEEAPVVALSSSGSGSNRLLRSISCPEILALLHHDCPWTAPPLPSLQHLRTPPSPPKQCPLIPPLPHLHSPSKRARRHTVCSLEVEREIAPLCLRKEVFPRGRGGLYGSPSHHLCPTAPCSPSTSLAALASSFLSSPLAFLSRRSARGSNSPGGGGGCDVTSSSSASLVITPSLSSSPFAPNFTAHHIFTNSIPGVSPRDAQSAASLSSLCSAPSQIPLEGDSGGERQQEGEEEEEEEDEEEDEDEGEGTTFCLELEASGMPEEKALSDSEIKMGDAKPGERGKVSSIRIRKTLPKPQNNLTPMGLPKPIRLKKKVFSLEEIYTNKNFSKPAEGRLETIFEVPLTNRRDGSQSLVSQKRVKRFVEFPELGVARKPKKPLIGGLPVPRKAGGNAVIGRTRRGGWTSSKDGDALSLQELDSLLCSKLDLLDSWIAVDQEAF